MKTITNIDIKKLIIEVLNEATDPRYNPSQEAAESLFEIMDSMKVDLINDFLQNPKGKQSWKFLPFNRIAKIWNDFSKTGFIRDEKGLDLIGTIVVENIIKVYINTILAGHTPLDPKLELEDIMSDEDIELLDWESLYEYITDDVSGHIRMSDYAMDKLTDDAARILDAVDPVDKLIAIDRALNRIHMRSDIAGWFLVGGTNDLNKLSGIDHE